MILHVSDFDAFTADFGVDAVVGGVTQRAIFDESYAEAFGMVSGSRPQLIVLTSPQAIRGASVVVSGKSYTVAEAHADGTGITMLQLEAV